jgi:hypothetical protein
MPNKSWTNFLRYGLALHFILGCRSVLGLDESENVGIPTPTPLEKPYSTFVPLRDVVEVKVNEELLLARLRPGLPDPRAAFRRPRRPRVRRIETGRRARRASAAARTRIRTGQPLPATAAATWRRRCSSPTH